MLTLNNGAFAALAFIGLSAPDSSAIAASPKPPTPAPTVSFVDYAQCANDASPSVATDCPGGWINGILNANNSHYPEDAVTPQRAEVSYPAGDALTGRTLTFRYETTKGGIHAYDSLATWNYTQTTALRNQGLNASDIAPATPTSTLDMSPDPFALGHELPVGNSRKWTMFGGTLTNASVPTHDCTTSLAAQCTGDDYATVTVTYNVPASAPGDNSVRNVQLLFGGHIAAAAGPRGWGANLGAGSVSGGPYHVKWALADGASIGNRDNQITSGTITIPPSLSITKTTSTSSVAIGGTATFTISVTNSANVTDNATGVQVTDTLPTGFTYASLTSATGGTRTATVNPTAGQTSLTFGTWSLAPGQTVSITFTATAPSAANSCTSYNNNASFTSTNGGSGTTSAPATVTVTGCAPSLSITKTTSTSSVALGAAATFNIQVANSANATATATGVQVTDTLPTGFTYASLTSATGGTRTATVNPTAGQTSLTFGTWSLAPGQTLSITFTATAPSTANSCGSYDNNAGYTSTNAGSGSTSSAATVTVTGCSGNLSITKTTSTATVALGGTATFTITVTNAANATLTATGVQITDTLPTGFVYAATGTAGGTGSRTATVDPTAGQTSLTFGTWSLAPGQTASVTFTATAPSGANSCAAYNNNASVSSGNDGSASTTSPATVTVTGCAPSLSITKTTSTSSIALGGAASFTITVTNAANATLTATGVQITDSLPTGFVFASGTSGGTGTRTATTNPTAGDTSLSWGTWSLAPGQTATATFTATAPSTANSCGSYDNNAGYTSTNAGSGSTSSAATVTVTGCAPGITITKTTSTASVTLGGAASFTITVTNAANATGTATGVQITDALPAGFVFASGTSGGTGTRTATTNPTAGQTSLTWGTWSLAPGQTATASFTATAPSSLSSCTSYNNNATVTWNPENSARTTSPATVTVTGCTVVTPPQLSISKTADATLVTASAQGGSQVGFTITLTNTGSVTTTATLSDTPLVAAGPTTPAGNAGTNGLTWSIDAATSDAGCAITANSLSCNFGSLAPGASKHVHITSPVAGRLTATSRNDNCGQRVDNVATAMMGNGATLQSNHATVDIACLPATSAGSLTITKYSDNNGNAAKDPGEAFLAGWTFEVKNNATGAVQSVTTDSNGTATLTGLEFGQYTVTEKSCASPCDITKWTAISYQVGTAAVVKSSSGSAQVSISSPQQSVTFGNRPPQLPSTSTTNTNGSPLQGVALLLIAAMLAEIAALRMRVRVTKQQG